MKETEHLKMEVLEKFIGRDLEGCAWCPVERHLAGCTQCLEKLERLLGIPHRPGSTRKSVHLFGATSRVSNLIGAKSPLGKKPG